MPPRGLRDRVMVLAIGVLVILAPVVIVLVALLILVTTGDLVFGRLTPLVFFELYLVELVLTAAFAYALYRLTLVLVERQLPDSLDALEEVDAERGDRDASSDDVE